MDIKDRLLYPELDMSHRLRIQIRFTDYDTFGHINNNSYLSFFDLGKSDFFHELTHHDGLPSDFSVAIVNINVDFLCPAVASEPLEVRTSVVKVGDRSFTVYQRIVNPDTEHVKAQAVSVLAGFDVKTQQGSPLSEAFREKLVVSMKG